jgi:signal transduction histidine kinase
MCNNPKNHLDQPLTKGIAADTSNIEELQLKNGIAEVFLTDSGNKIYQGVLSLLLDYFQSPYGIFGYIGREGEFVCPAITTTIWDKCSLIEKDAAKDAIVFHPEVWGGLWGRGLREHQRLVSSGPFHLPQGHMQLQEVIVMPIMYKGSLIGQIVMANKIGGYNQQDETVLSKICNYLAPLLQARLEREWARQDLELAKSRAESANLVKSQFLANMSHELRTPLHGMLGCLQLLECEQSSSECKELVQIARHSGSSLLQLINDILEFSSIDLEDRLQEREFCLTQELDALFGVFSHQLQTKEISLHYELCEYIPEQLVGDVARLRQILLRLVGNAIKFSNQGPVNISAHTLHRPDKNGIHPYLHLNPNKVNLLFVIADRGIGLSDEQVHNIFDLFTQGNMSLSRGYSGSGLGLSIVKKNMKLMCGNIAIDNSRPGTSIYLGLSFTLPEKYARQTTEER